MIKKLLYGCTVFLLVLGILLPGMAGNAYAAKFSGTAGEGIYWSFREETGVLMVYGTGEMPDYSETAAYYPPWEKWDSAIRDLVIAEGITSVGAEAFRGCSNLMSVTFPSTVKVIQAGAFWDCISLREARLPYSVTTIGDFAFSGCERIRSMNIPDSVTSIGDRAFAGCVGLGTVILPGQTKNLDSDIFGGCAGLCDIYFRGSAPSGAVLTESWGIFQRTGVTLRFVEGQTGWTTPTWNGFPTQTWSGFMATDVEPTDYFYDSVQWAMESEITLGVGKDRFCPENTCTRGQTVTFLWRAAGCPEPKTTSSPFVDVSHGDYFYKAVLWAVERGITNGVGKGRFAPESLCTRGQVATFLWRAKGNPASASGQITFTDVPTDGYYAQAILWAVEQGITKGVGDGRFAPNDLCTRGQIVTFLWRMAGQPKTESGLEPYYDFITEKIESGNGDDGSGFYTGQMWDIDGDGTKELILWSRGNWAKAMGEVYTIRNGVVEPLLQQWYICTMVGGNASDCGVAEIDGELYFYTLARYYEPSGYVGYDGADSYTYVWDLFSLRNGEMSHMTEVSYHLIEAFRDGESFILPEENYGTVDGVNITAEEYEQWRGNMDIVLSLQGYAMNFNSGNGYSMEELLFLCR